MSPATKGVVVVLAGFALTFFLGSLFIEILVASELLRPLSDGGSYGWSVAQVSVPFAFAAGSFVVGMIVGGNLQDRLGPRWPSTVGGVMIGLGMIVASISIGQVEGVAARGILLILGLGLMGGGGAGLTLACTVPPAVKWSVPRRHGLVVGVVLSGLALGPLWLNGAAAAVGSHAVSWTLMIQGIALLAAIVCVSQLLEDPLAGYVPPGSYSDSDGRALNPVPWTGLSSRRMMRTVAFRSLWASSALLSAGSAFLVLLLVLLWTSDGLLGVGVVFSVSSGGIVGGLVAGSQQDRTGRVGPWPVVATMVAGLAAAALFLAMGQMGAAAFLASASCVGGFVVEWLCTIECFGTRSAGQNFGLVFTGGSVGGLVGAVAAVLVAGGALTGPHVSVPNIAVTTAFLLGLGMAVAFASRVQPPATLYVLDGGRRDRLGRTRS